MLIHSKDDIEYVTRPVYEFWYNSDTVLYELFETRPSDKIIIGGDQCLNFLGFSLYPFHFTLTFSLRYNSIFQVLKNVKKNLFSRKLKSTCNRYPHQATQKTGSPEKVH